MTSVEQSAFTENASVSRSSVKQQASGLQDRRSVAFATPRKPLGNVSNDPSKSAKQSTTGRKASAFTPKPKDSLFRRDAGTPALRPGKVGSRKTTALKPSEHPDFDEMKSFEGEHSCYCCPRGFTRGFLLDFLEPPTHEFNVDDVTSGLLALRSEFTPAFAVPARPKKQKKEDPWKVHRKFLILHKPSRQEEDDDDYLAVREKDKEYLAKINLDTLLY